MVHIRYTLAYDCAVLLQKGPNINKKMSALKNWSVFIFVDSFAYLGSNRLILFLVSRLLFWQFWSDFIFKPSRAWQRGGEEGRSRWRSDIHSLLETGSETREFSGGHLGNVGLNHCCVWIYERSDFPEQAGSVGAWLVADIEHDNIRVRWGCCLLLYQSVRTVQPSSFVRTGSLHDLLP